MLQAKLGGSMVVAGLISWGAYVTHTRQTRMASMPRPGQRRFGVFTPGSADDLLSEDLRTGDVVLFNRDPTAYLPLGAASITLAHVTSGDAQSFDHAGMIVMHKGEPHVVEVTFSGTKLRRYDERVYLSTAHEIIVRQITPALTPDQERSLVATLRARQLETAANGFASAGVLFAFISDVLRWTSTSPSAELISDLYTAVGVVAGSADTLTVADLSPPSQPLASHSLGDQLLVRLK